MKSLQLTFAAATTVLFCSALPSCKDDEAASDPVQASQAQENREAQEVREAPPQQAAPAMPGHMARGKDGMMEQARAGCPMVVEGVDVTVSDVDDGVALAFTTAKGDRDDLRGRVRHMARMYEMRRGRGGMMWRRMGGKGRGRGMGPMAGQGPMPAATATVEDTEAGARIELRPEDPSQLDVLRERVRLHQERMKSGQCWMMQGGS